MNSDKSMSDYELCSNFKTLNDSSALVVLFERYKALVDKMYSLHIRMGKNYLPKEDFFQEAFIRLYKTMEYIKLAKVYDPENWSIYPFFRWTLFYIIINHLKSYGKYKDVFSDLPLEEVEDMGKEDKSFSEIEMKEFITTLSEKEKNILLEKMFPAYIMTIPEILEKNKISRAYLYKIIDIVKDKYLSFYF